jgi:hypothetical protein
VDLNIEREQGMDVADRSENSERVQLSIPGRCSSDSDMLNRWLQQREILSTITSEEDRQTIWSNLLRIDTLIPSLYAFFEDIKYLKPCATVVKRLFGGKPEGSVRKSLRMLYKGENQRDDQVLVQETETLLRPYGGTITDRINLGTFQLWLFAARNFTYLIKEYPKKEDGRPPPRLEEPDPSTWSAFATLAYNLGFTSDEILRMKNANPDLEVARAALLEARKPPRFRYDSAAFQSQIMAMFATATEVTSEPSNPTFFVEIPERASQGDMDVFLRMPTRITAKSSFRV